MAQRCQAMFFDQYPLDLVRERFIAYDRRIPSASSWRKLAACRKFELNDALNNLVAAQGHFTIIRPASKQAVASVALQFKSFSTEVNRSESASKQVCFAGEVFA